jgi:hypothetical protein
MFERQRHQALNRVGLSRLGGGRRWNVNVGVYDVVEEVGHAELHRERDDLEDRARGAASSDNSNSSAGIFPNVVAGNVWIALQ